MTYKAEIDGKVCIGTAEEIVDQLRKSWRTVIAYGRVPSRRVYMRDAMHRLYDDSPRAFMDILAQLGIVEVVD